MNNDAADAGRQATNRYQAECRYQSSRRSAAGWWGALARLGPGRSQRATLSMQDGQLAVTSPTGTVLMRHALLSLTPEHGTSVLTVFQRDKPVRLEIARGGRESRMTFPDELGQQNVTDAGRLLNELNRFLARPKFDGANGNQ